MKKMIWLLLLVLFLLASIFPPWNHSRVPGITFSPFYNPPDFADTKRQYSVNGSTYTNVYEGHLFWKLLCFEYFMIGVSCMAIKTIFREKEQIKDGIF